MPFSRICLLISSELDACLNNLLSCRVPLQILNKKECPDVFVLFFQFLLTHFFKRGEWSVTMTISCYEPIKHVRKRRKA